MAGESGYRNIRPGTPLTAREINNNLVRGPQRGVKVSGNADKRNRRDGYSLDFPDSGGQSPSSNYSRWAQVQATHDDYLEVKMYNVVAESSSGATFGAAKPYLNQLSTHPTETEIYAANDLVVITKAPSNFLVAGETLRWVVQGGSSSPDTSDDTKSADTKANLAPLIPNDGQRGFTTTVPKRYYVRINGGLVCLSHLE